MFELIVLIFFYLVVHYIVVDHCQKLNVQVQVNIDKEDLMKKVLFDDEHHQQLFADEN